MKSTPLLNSQISSVISKMGHTDKLTISDAGLPIPNGVERIDIALVAGTPGFLETLKAVFLELKVEKAYIASEIKDKNKAVYDETIKILNSKNVEIIYISHSEFKELSKSTKAVVRTGEVTSFANIILESGVVF